MWWNLMDTYNTRTPIRGSSREKLKAMGDDPEYAPGWTEHAACRHSAGHMYLLDGELAMIPARVAQRASRIGYRVMNRRIVTGPMHQSDEQARRRRA